MEFVVEINGNAKYRGSLSQCEHKFNNIMVEAIRRGYKCEIDEDGIAWVELPTKEQLTYIVRARLRGDSDETELED